MSIIRLILACSAIFLSPNLFANDVGIQIDSCARVLAGGNMYQQLDAFQKQEIIWQNIVDSKYVELPEMSLFTRGQSKLIKIFRIAKAAFTLGQSDSAWD